MNRSKAKAPTMPPTMPAIGVDDEEELSILILFDVRGLGGEMEYNDCVHNADPLEEYIGLVSVVDEDERRFDSVSVEMVLLLYVDDDANVWDDLEGKEADVDGTGPAVPSSITSNTNLSSVNWEFPSKRVSF